MLIPSYASGFAPRDGAPEYPGLRQGLMGEWLPYLGPTGLKLHDWSGRRKNGTLTNMDPASDWAASLYGWSLDYDGSAEHIVIPATVTDYPVTLAAWFNSDNLTANQNIITLADTSDTKYFGLRAMGADVGDPLRASSSGTHVDGNAYAAGSWECGAAVFVSTSDVRLYQNGVLTGSGTGAAVSGIDNTRIGCLQWNSGAPIQYFNGRIGPVRVWNRALNASEIVQLYIDPFAPSRLRRRVYPVAAAVGARGSYIIGGGIAA